MATPSGRPLQRGLALAIAAMAVVVGAGGAVALGSARAEHRRTAQEAARLRADGDQALHEVLDLLSYEVQRVALLTPLRAALSREVDAATFADLLNREPWWAPFRTRLLVVMPPDGRLLASEPRALSITDPFLLENARVHPPAAAWVGAGGPFAAAAVPVSSPRGDQKGATLLVLGLIVDLPFARALAARLSASVLLTDGHRRLLFGGDPRRREALEAAVGAEKQPWTVDRSAGLVAVPLAVVPSRWLWVLREIGSRRPFSAPWVGPMLLAVAVLAGGLAWALYRAARVARRE